MARSFAAISDAIAHGSSFESVRSKLNEIDFLSFTMDEMKMVETATWLPLDRKANILRKWIRAQDALIAEIQGVLVLHSRIPKEVVETIIAAIGNPTIERSLEEETIVTNIFQKLATGGGNRDPLNPAAQRLITVEVDSQRSDEPAPDSDHGVYKAFDGKLDTYYVSASAASRFIRIILPPFLLVKLTSYSMTSPVAGMMTWNLQGKVRENDAWQQIDSVTRSTEFAQPRGHATFTVDGKDYFRYFQLEQMDENAQKNLSIYLGTLDFSGKVILTK
jgi:hypothetical protein